MDDNTSILRAVFDTTPECIKIVAAERNAFADELGVVCSKLRKVLASKGWDF
jgi:hypothetical protein